MRETGKHLARRVLIMVAALVAAMSLTPATAAHADWTSVLRSWAQGNCLDSNWVGETYTVPCNGGNFQNWHVEERGLTNCDPNTHACSVMYQVRNAQTDRCLDSDWSGALYTSGCQDSNRWQKWFVTSNNWDQVRFFDNVETGRCLDANVPDGRPYTNAVCYSGGYQDWKPGF